MWSPTRRWRSGIPGATVGLRAQSHREVFLFCLFVNYLSFEDSPAPCCFVHEEDWGRVHTQPNPTFSISAIRTGNNNRALKWIFSSQLRLDIGCYRSSWNEPERAELSFYQPTERRCSWRTEYFIAFIFYFFFCKKKTKNLQSLESHMCHPLSSIIGN